jgi:hypothetical protein
LSCTRHIDTPGASQADLLAVAWQDFRANSADAWAPYDTPENVEALTAIAVKEKCSIATAFMLARDAGTLVAA